MKVLVKHLIRPSLFVWGFYFFGGEQESGFITLPHTVGTQEAGASRTALLPAAREKLQNQAEARGSNSLFLLWSSEWRTADKLGVCAGS